MKPLTRDEYSGTRVPILSYSIRLVCLDGKSSNVGRFLVHLTLKICNQHKRKSFDGSDTPVVGTG